VIGGGLVRRGYSGRPGADGSLEIALGGVGMMRWKGTSDEGPVPGRTCSSYDHDGKIARCTTFFEGG